MLWEEGKVEGKGRDQVVSMKVVGQEGLTLVRREGQ